MKHVRESGDMRAEQAWNNIAAQMNEKGIHALQLRRKAGRSRLAFLFLVVGKFHLGYRKT